MQELTITRDRNKKKKEFQFLNSEGREFWFVLFLIFSLEFFFLFNIFHLSFLNEDEISSKLLYIC